MGSWELRGGGTGALLSLCIANKLPGRPTDHALEKRRGKDLLGVSLPLLKAAYNSPGRALRGSWCWTTR